MINGYYCAIFPFCGGEKKKDDKKTKAFYDWATTGIPVKITKAEVWAHVLLTRLNVRTFVVCLHQKSCDTTR